MIGVPPEDRERVVSAADVLVSVADPEFFGDRRPIEVLGEALWTLTQFATELAAHREKHPGDDLMTALVQAEVEGERLTHAEIGAFFVLLSVAGNDTTRHTTSHAMRALTVNPDQRAWLMEDLDGRLPVAVEEFVRWASAVLDLPPHHHPRGGDPWPAAGGGGEGGALLPLGQPRRGGVHRTVALRSVA